MDITKHQQGIEALLKENGGETENRTPYLDAARGSLSNALINLKSHSRELDNRAALATKRLEEQREALKEAEAAELKKKKGKAETAAAPQPAAN